jgi:amino-acid N-acetyltransferase
MEIEHFTVVERDGMIIGCAAVYFYSKNGCVELACLAIHPQYQNRGRGDFLLAYIERHTKALGIFSLFVLSTRAMHWFQERGFVKKDIEDLPVQRKALYNYQRNSNVFFKSLT